ncbi:MAG: glycosyltransferase family 39 protein, partial [Anaerolineae bacterium]|nr:glycosyltransferase family 39 protein [Anaerolineae bacterium]
GGTPAAWFAGLVWAFSSEIVDRNNQALPDPFVYLTVAASLVMVIHALRQESPRWLFGSLLAGIAAIYFKYTPWYIVIPWGIVALTLLRRHPRRMLPWLIAQALAGLLCAWYLLVNYAALELPNREVETFRGEGLMMAFTPWRNFNNFWSATRPMGEIVFVVTLALGLVAYLYSRRRKGWVVDWRGYGIFLIYGVIGLLMISSFTNVWQGSAKYRHTMPVTIALLGLWSAAASQIIHTLAMLRREKPASRIFWWAPMAAALALVLVFTVPNVALNARRIEVYQKVFTQNILWTWTDQNIPLEGRILTRSNDILERVWNRWWGGYDGKKPFEWWHEAPIPQNTPAEYVDRGIMYFAITDTNLATDYDRVNKADVREFEEQLVHVKTIPNDAPDVLGPAILFYRMIPPQVETHVVFDNRITLVGYDMATGDLHPGGGITFRPYWRVTEVPRSNYSMFVHLYPADSDQIVAQYDGAPAQPGRLTLTWTDLDELYIGSDVQLQLPDDLAPGDYRLAIGLYDYLTGERLQTDHSGDLYTLNLSIK